VKIQYSTVAILLVASIATAAVTKIQVRRGTDANLPATLSYGEPAFTTDTHRAFYGYSTGKEELITLSYHRNYSTATQTKLNGKVGTSDSRLTDDRNPTAHTQAISTVTGLQTALDNFSTATQGKLDSKELAGSTASHNALGSAHSGQFVGKQDKILTVYDIGTCTAATTLLPTNGKEQMITLGTGCSGTIQLGASTTAQELFLRVKQPIAGKQTFLLNYSGAGVSRRAVKWPGGVAPTFTNTSSAQDAVACRVYSDTAICNITQDLK
jgi:hypothetical protein